MTKRTYKLIAVVTFAVLAWLGFYNYILPQNPALLPLFEPEGLFDPIAELKIEKENLNETLSFDFEHKYAGEYLVGLYFSNPSPYGTPIENCGIIELSAETGGKAPFSRNYTMWRDRFGGPSEKIVKNAGVLFDAYNVPNNINRNTKVNANVTLNLKKQCFEKYGPFTFFIKRSGK